MKIIGKKIELKIKIISPELKNFLPKKTYTLKMITQTLPNQQLEELFV